MRFHPRFFVVPLVIWALDAVTSFELTILHTNDVHGRFEQYTIRDGRCHPDDAISAKGCFGGLARRATQVKAFRNRTRNVILLDAGDQFQGTPWFYYYKGKAASHFMDRLSYDAMSLGNHEFDNGIDGLIPFLKNVTFPVVCSNVRFEREPKFLGLVNRSTILDVGGQRIGIVGYLTQDTPTLSNTGHLEFEDEVTAVQTEVDRLTRDGVKIIIGLGHAGFNVDKDIAQRVKDIDVVIGGHTNTFLYSGTQPSREVPEGPYPLVYTNATGEKTLVLEGYAFGKYLGHLTLVFDEKGGVTNWTGNPILLDKTVEQDPEFLEELDKWGSEVHALYLSVVGFSTVFLNGAFESCRLEECVLGNLITDAMVEHYKKGNWPDLNIALMNGGGIRSSIEEGNITYEDVLRAMPFSNSIDIVELKGRNLIRVLEYSVANYSREMRSGRFTQVSGLKIIYDIGRPNGDRVLKVEVLCNNCSSGTYLPLEEDAVYKVAIPSYVAKGGDGYNVIPKTVEKHYNLGDVDADIFLEYLKRSSPVSPRLEGRIRVLEKHTSFGPKRSMTANETVTDTSGCSDFSRRCKFTDLSIALLFVLVLRTQSFW